MHVHNFIGGEVGEVTTCGSVATFRLGGWVALKLRPITQRRLPPSLSRGDRIGLSSMTSA
eukprot:5002540-Amphidinium_carterae.1